MDWQTNTIFCAGNPPAYAQAVCQADSGGPILLPSPDGNPRNDTVLGVASLTGLFCSGSPNGFTSAAQERRWIDATVQGLLGGSWAARWTNTGEHRKAGGSVPREGAGTPVVGASLSHTSACLCLQRRAALRSRASMGRRPKWLAWWALSTM